MQVILQKSIEKCKIFTQNSMEIYFYTPIGVVARLVTGCEITEYAPPTMSKNRFNRWYLYYNECQRIMTFYQQKEYSFFVPHQIEKKSRNLLRPRLLCFLVAAM